VVGAVDQGIEAAAPGDGWRVRTVTDVARPETPYEARVRELEEEGLTTSDAQGVADAECGAESVGFRCQEPAGHEAGGAPTHRSPMRAANRTVAMFASWPPTAEEIARAYREKARRQMMKGAAR
jgi:hypothetical protein